MRALLSTAAAAQPHAGVARGGGAQHLHMLQRNRTAATALTNSTASRPNLSWSGGGGGGGGGGERLMGTTATTMKNHHRRATSVAPLNAKRETPSSSGVGFGSGPLLKEGEGVNDPGAGGGVLPVGADTIILGIETSCDDTGAAVVTGDGRVLDGWGRTLVSGEALASQVEIHAPWGGVVPNLAQEAHKEAIDGVIEAALSKAGVSEEELSAVAVTVGPGLSMCLRVGVVAAQNICARHAKPIVPVHHMEAHALVARLAGGTEAVKFPFLALLVSGGHNQLILARGVGDYTILGSTLDDALGEAYDKTARLLGLNVGGGGGPALEALAKEGDPKSYRFPVPLRQRKNCDFSYAGLKTAVRMAIERDLGIEDPDAFTKVHTPGESATPAEGGSGGSSDSESEGGEQDIGSTATAAQKEGEIKNCEEGENELAERKAKARRQQRIRADIAASFQQSAVKHLEERARRSVQWANDSLAAAAASSSSPDDPPPPLSCMVVAGGVAANQTVRARLAAVADEAGLPLVLPPPKWCTDNGVMVAWAGVERLALGLGESPPTEEQVREPPSSEENNNNHNSDDNDGREERRERRRDVPLLPRWPLGERDARATGDVKSSKKVRMAPPLTPADAGVADIAAPGVALTD